MIMIGGNSVDIHELDSEIDSDDRDEDHGESPLVMFIIDCIKL